MNLFLMTPAPWKYNMNQEYVVLSLKATLTVGCRLPTLGGNYFFTRE